MAVSSWVESVEFVDTTIAGTSTSRSINLTKGQNYENCIPFFTIYGSQDYWDCKLTDVYFSGTTESGIINFRRWDIRNANVVNVKCYVVEFNPEQVRVQQGSFNVSLSTTHTVTLGTTLSGTNRAAMTFGWRANDGQQYPQRVFVRGRVTGTSSIDFYRNSTSSSCDGHWFLFEDLGNNFRVTHKSSSFSSSGQTTTIDGGRTIDPFRTFLLGSYASNNTNAGYADRWASRNFLYSDGSIRWDKTNVSYSTIYWATQIFEFVDKTKVYVPFDHYPDGWTSATIRNRVVGGTSTRVPWKVNLDTSSVVVGCMQGITRGVVANNTGQINELMTGAWLTASGTITKAKTTGSYAIYPSYTVAVDWAGIDIDIGTADPADIIPEGNDPGQSFVRTVENFRFTLEDHVGARVLSKGQSWGNCVAFVSCRGTSGDYVREHMAKVKILEPGIVYFKSWDTTGQNYIDVSIVEFWPDQVKVQHIDRYTQLTQTINQSIEDVASLDRCFIRSTIFNPHNTQYGREGFARVRFTSTSNVEIYRGGSGQEVDVSFFVIEDLGDNFRTSHHTPSSFSGQTYSWYNMSRVWTPYNSFLNVSYTTNSNGVYPAMNFIRSYMLYEFVPAYSDKSSTSNYIIYPTYTIVTFLDNRRRCSQYVATISTNNPQLYYYSEEFVGHEHAISLFHTTNNSTGRCNTNDAAGISEGFFTARITDYGTREIEITKQGTSYTSYATFSFVDWIGVCYQDEDNILPSVPTRSKPLVSIERYYSDSTTSYHVVCLTKRQDINQCVPFVVNAAGRTDNEFLGLFKAVYRFDDPDMFVIRFGYGQQINRDLTMWVLEFDPSVKVQYGFVDMTGTSKQVTIDEVNMDRAFLHFYGYGSSGEDYPRSHFICGRIKDSTTLEFYRYNSSQSSGISWYVIECAEQGEDSYWRVQRDYRTSLGGSNNVYSYLSKLPYVDRTMFLASYTSTASSVGPRYCFYRGYNRQDEVIQFNKLDSSSYSMQNLEVQAIEFSKDMLVRGFKVVSDFFSMSTTNPATFDLKQFEAEKFQIYRSIAMNMNSQNTTRCDTADENGFREGFHHYEFIDDGDGYSDSIQVTKSHSSYTQYNYIYAIQFPEFNKYYFEGYTSERGVYVPRIVRAYRADTHKLVDTTMSVSGTGYFWVETPYEGEHYIICEDDEEGFDYNDLIYSRVYPTVISGSFAYREGDVTTSGLSIGVPLGLQ